MLVKRKKGQFVITALLIAAMVIVMAGCGSKGGDAPAPAPAEPPAAGDSATTETPAPPAASTGEKVELVMGHPFAATHPIQAQVLEPLAKALSEQSDGRITLTIHAGAAITSAATVREDVVSGAMDIGWTLPGYSPGKYPLTDCIENPFMFETTEQASSTLWKVYEQSADFQAEYGDVKVLGLWCVDPGEVLSLKKVEYPEDLKGLNIRVPGPSIEQAIKLFGGNPALIPMPNVYDQISQTILDGVAVGCSTIMSYKLNEIIKNATHGLNYFYSTQAVFMNKDKWNSLSPEDQALIDSLTGSLMNEQATALYLKDYDLGMQAAKDSGVEITEITPEVRAQWMEKTTDVEAKWIADTTAKGIPAQEFLDLVRKIANDGR